MSKFAGTTRTPTRTNLRSPMKTTTTQIPTFEGGDAYVRDAESELFLLAATNMVGEDTFYETAADRDKRFADLVRKVTEANPGFIAGRDPEVGYVGLAEYLRRDLLMRSASIVLAAEYTAAGGANARSVVNRVCQRPDEPAEFIGYWLTKFGRKLPWPVKRGLGDAVRRLYTERNVLRYDGQSKAIRFGDVIELVHPTPKDETQSALFKYLLSVRHRGTDARVTEQLSSLPTLTLAKRLDAMSDDALRSYLTEKGGEALAEAGWSWERLSGRMKMDATAWEWAMDNMGVMALVRNLRNFDEAGIPDVAVDKVIAKITDPDEVAKARLFPYQTWSAMKAAPSLNWGRALGTTLDLTTRNIPNLDGTLVVIDTSGSMQTTVSAKSQISRVEIAAVMAASTAKHCSSVNVVIFGQGNRAVPIPAGESVLKTVDRVNGLIGSVGHSTYGHTAIRDHFKPNAHKRVVMFTDDQQHDSATLSAHVPLLYTFNLAGYRPSSTESGSDGRHTLGGFSDATFTLMKVLETGKDAAWPF